MAKASRSTERGAVNPQLDSALDRLSDIIGTTIGTSSERPSSRPIAEEPSSRVEPRESQPPPEPEQFMQMREWLARELMYMQLIPPLTPDLLMKLDKSLDEFPEFLKSLRDRPFLLTLIDQAMASARQQTSNSGAERDFGNDPELAHLAERMARDMAGDSEERILPVVAVLIGAAVASAVGGVTVGRAVYEATH